MTGEASLLTFEATQRLTSSTVPKPAPIRRSPGVSGASVQGWVLPHLLAWLEAQQFDTARLRRLPGLSSLDDPDVRVPESSAAAAWHEAASLSGDAAIGIHVAQFLPRGALDLVEYAFRASASLAEGLGRLARYGRVATDRLSARMDTNGEGLLLMIRDASEVAAHGGRAEFALALVLKLAREGTGHPITPLQVSVADPAPASRREHDRFYGVPVRFDAGVFTMTLSAADAQRPLIGADAALLQVIRRRLDRYLTERERADAGAIAQRVRHVIEQQLGETAVTPDTVARELAMSRRTLSRRLAEDATSFRDVLDHTRRDLACALLLDQSLSISDIAFFLQYSEPAAFNRSFRRWTGTSPRAYRTRT